MLGGRGFHRRSAPEQDESTYVVPRARSVLKGLQLIRDRRWNKGTAFTVAERRYLDLEGLLPSGVFTQDEQCERVLLRLRESGCDIDRYKMLMDLQGRNQKLFYYVVQKHCRELMPIIYTPTVGLACQGFGNMGKNSRGININLNHRGRIREVLQNWESESVQAIVFTDGERILGLGDLGANGMGIPLGKLGLYTALGGIDPQKTLPVTLDVGTNNEDLLADEFYTGLKMKRATGREYEALIDEFITAAKAEFGARVLLQWEDFGNANAFRLLRKYKDKCCTFNDDIQGTAAVVTAGVLAALPATRLAWPEHKFLFMGAGSAGLGIAELIAKAHSKAVGCSLDEARANIYCVDSKGLVYQDRPSGGLNEDKLPFAHPWADADTLGSEPQSLETYVKALGITGIFGVSAQGGVFTPEVIQAVSANCEKPIVFALSNPTSKAECTAEAAYEHSGGHALFASGSPFDEVILPDGSIRVPGQGNNSYIFPGVALAVISVKATRIPDAVFLTAAEALATLVTKEDLEAGTLYPSLDRIREVSAHIAAAVAEDLYYLGVATAPRPRNLVEFCRDKMWDCTYENYCPASLENTEEYVYSSVDMP